MANRAGMPTPKRIASWWTEHNHHLDGRGHGFLADECWACGTVVARIERCHIVPVSKGGSNHESNLMLLCRRHHEEQEPLEQQSIPWLMRIRSSGEWKPWWEWAADMAERKGINVLALWEKACAAQSREELIRIAADEYERVTGYRPKTATNAGCERARRDGHA